MPSSSLSQQSEQNKLKAEATVREKQSERMVAEEEAKIEKVRAEAALIRAKSEAEQRTLLAKAYAEEKKAETKFHQLARSADARLRRACEAWRREHALLHWRLGEASELLVPPGLRAGSVAHGAGELPPAKLRFAHEAHRRGQRSALTRISTHILERRRGARARTRRQARRCRNGSRPA